MPNDPTPEYKSYPKLFKSVRNFLACDNKLNIFSFTKSLRGLVVDELVKIFSLKLTANYSH